MAKFTEIRYAVKTRKAMEDYIYTHSVAEIIEFIKSNAVVEDYDEMFIPKNEHEFVYGTIYDMFGDQYKGDEFVITDENRLFYCVSTMTNTEIVDC